MGCVSVCVVWGKREVGHIRCLEKRVYTGLIAYWVLMIFCRVVDDDCC